MARLTFAALACAAAVSVACGMAAQAATLQISPVTIELSPGQNAAALTLSNSGNQPIYGQVRIFRWDQADGQDTLIASQELVASPPLIQIDPRGEQMIRLIKTTQVSSTKEASYRILIDEIPQPETPDSTGVMIRLRYSVPVFVQAVGEPGAALVEWQLGRDGEEWVLTATNTGNRYARISRVQLVDGNGRVHGINKGLLGYALAGKERRWKITLPTGTELGGKTRIRAVINALPVEDPVLISPG